MKLSRVYPLEWLVGVAGVGVLVGLFLPWSDGSTALEPTGFLDVLLILAGVAGLLIPVVVASSSRTNAPIVSETLLGILTLPLILVLVIKAVFPPEPGFQSGFWVVCVAMLLLSYSVWRSAAREG